MAEPKKRSLLKPLKGCSIGVIGAGKMGQSLIKGLLAAGFPSKNVFAAEQSSDTRAKITRQFRVRTTASPEAIAQQCDVVVLAVKPQQMADVIRVLAPSMGSKHLVISIAAGVPLFWLQSRLPHSAVVRAMPNLPVTVGAGFTALAAGKLAKTKHIKQAQALFEAVGTVSPLPESDFDAITAVSGSGPAYVFFLLQAWRQAAVSLGLSESVAAQAVVSTLRGSLALLEQLGEEPGSLIAKVASKGGTTEAALQVFEENRLRERFSQALVAAAQRSKELSCQFC